MFYKIKEKNGVIINNFGKKWSVLLEHHGKNRVIINNFGKKMECVIMKLRKKMEL